MNPYNLEFVIWPDASRKSTRSKLLEQERKRNIPDVNLPIVSGKPTHLSGIKLITLGKPHSLIQRHSWNLFSSKVKSQLAGYFDKRV